MLCPDLSGGPNLSAASERRVIVSHSVGQEFLGDRHVAERNGHERQEVGEDKVVGHQCLLLPAQQTGRVTEVVGLIVECEWALYACCTRISVSRRTLRSTRTISSSRE